MSKLATIYARVLILGALILALSGCGMGASTEMAAQQAEPLSDGEIVAVLHAINEGEIRQAELALQRSQNREVTSAARLILEDHQAADQRVAQTAREEGVTPQENELSQGLREQAMTLREELAQLSGEEFDQAYLERQVELHEVALNTVEEHLRPNAENPQILALVEAAAPELEMHLDMADEGLDQVQG